MLTGGHVTLAGGCVTFMQTFPRDMELLAVGEAGETAIAEARRGERDGVTLQTGRLGARRKHCFREARVAE